MKFTYNGETLDLLEDNIIDKENFLSANENDEGVNIILRHGIRQLCERFAFVDKKTDILACTDTKDYGTVLAVQITLTGKDKDGSAFEFVGDGEVNGNNFNSKNVCYPFAVAVKRARSRAVLWKLGLNAYGEEEAESFVQAVKAARRKKRGSTTTKKTAPAASNPAPKAPSKPSAPPAEGAITKAEAQEKWSHLKKVAEEVGVSSTDMVNIMKSPECLDIKGLPTIDQLTNNPHVFEKAEGILRSMSGSAN